MRGTTLTPHIDAYLLRRRALHTYSARSVREVRYRLASLDRSFGRRPIDRLTPRAIEAWLESIAHLSANSRGSYLASARRFTAWLAAEGLIAVDPCLGIESPRRADGMPRVLSPADVAAILAACRTDRERAVVHLMVGLGLRRMEVAALRWEHYDERAGALWVAPSKGGRSERTLPVVDGAAAALARIRDHREGPVIRSELDGGPLGAPRIGALVSRAMARAGVKRAPYDGISGHALRHTAASDVLDESADLRAVQEMLGHRRLTTTAIYLRRRSNLARLREAMEGRTYGAEAA